MSGLGTFNIDDVVTFSVNTHTPTSGAATDADAVPSYRVYEDETGTAILTGNMAKLDDANTTGYYSEQLTLSAANGFENGKSYNIYVSAAVGGTTGTKSFQFQVALQKVDVTAISGDSTAADNLEAACDGTGYNLGNGSVVAASVTGSVGGNVVGSVASVTAGVTVTTNNDKTSYSLAADQSGITIGTVNALGTSAVNSVNAEMDTALADIHLDHLLAADYDPASKPGTSTALLNELIESDSGVSRFTANALEQAPSGGGTVDANITQIEGHALAGTGTQIADAFEHFFNVATPSKTINDCGVAGSGLSAQDVWEYNISAISTAGQAGKIVNDIVADTNELQSDDVPGLITALNDLSAADVWTYDISGVVTTDQAGEVLNKTYTAANDADSAASANTTAIGLLNDLSQADVRSAVGLSAANLDTALGAIVADTNELQTDWTDGGRLDLILDTAASGGGGGGDATAANQSTIITHLTDIKGGTFSDSTDSLEAIRDRGDAAWTTGAGGSPPQLLQSTTIATLASQTSFTLTAGSSDNDAYAGATVVITDAVTSTQKAVGVVASYTGDTKTITLTADPGVFTMAAGDSIAIIAGTFVASAGGTVGWLG